MNDVTIAFVFRERQTPTIASLKQIIETTTEPHDMIVFDDASPPEMAHTLREMAAKHGFMLLRNDTQTPPNHQRNACFEHVKTPYVVFIDNDVTVEPGWLDALVTCAKETGAALVSPLYLETIAGKTRIHMFGGQVTTKTDDGEPAFDERHFFAHERVEDNEQILVRSETGLVEFHAVLVETQILRDFGGLDPDLLSVAEHADLSVRVLQAGRKIIREPSSRITYHIPARLEPEDKAYFQQRWSETWNETSCNRLAVAHGVPAQDERIQMVFRWGRMHRQRASLRFPTLRRVLGKTVFDKIMRRYIKPWEVKSNRRRFPHGAPAQAVSKQPAMAEAA